MTDAEWVTLAEQLDQAFKGEFDEGKERVYRRYLEQLGYDRSQAALDMLVLKGQVFLPSAGEIVEAAGEASGPPAPTFDEAWAVVRPALSDSATVMARLGRVGAADEVMAWVASYGAQRMAREHVDDDVYGGAVMQKLRQSYAQFVECAAHRRALGLPILEAGVAAARGLRKPVFGGALPTAPLQLVPGGAA